MRLLLKHVLECVDLGSRVHKLGEQPAVLTPGLGNLDEGRPFVPADELASHHERRAVAIDAALLVEHVERILGIIQDDNRLA